MKKKTSIRKLNAIISDMTDLETEIARHTMYVADAFSKPHQLQWFHKLTKLTSRLNDIYRDETG